MEIRRIEPAEADAFFALRLRGLRERPAAFGATYEENLSLSPEERRSRCANTDEAVAMGAFDEQGTLVGIGRFLRDRSRKSRHKGVIVGMYVAPEARRRGIGRALLAALIDRARAMPGLERINLDVVASEEAARALYLSQGFRIYGLERKGLKQDGTYYDVEYMSLELG